MANATRMSDRQRSLYVGRYTGTTAAQDINIGFKPAMIISYNQTDGDKVWIWSKNDNTKICTIDTEVANECAVVAAVDDGSELGFSLPACNTSINENGKVFVFIAIPD